MCVFMGLIISFVCGNFLFLNIKLTKHGFSGSGEDDIYKENLIHPLVLKISKWLPGKPRQFIKEAKTEPGLVDIQVTKTSADLNFPYTQGGEKTENTKIVRNLHRVETHRQ